MFFFWSTLETFCIQRATLKCFLGTTDEEKKEKRYLRYNYALGLLRRRFLCKLSLHSFIFPKKSEEKSCLSVKTEADLDDWKLETRRVALFLIFIHQRFELLWDVFSTLYIILSLYLCEFESKTNTASVSTSAGPF